MVRDATSAGVNTQTESLLGRVLESYLSDLEDGTACQPDELVAAHPDLATELRACLESLHFVHQVREVSATDEVTALPALGDFQIIREIGRGGMGVVYEAQQITLQRRVALKILPLAGMLEPRSLERFRNEARAAASLHHTNIVPVYFVGCDRGVHFYAMPLVDGPTVADLIRTLGRQREPVESTLGGSPASPICHAADETLRDLQAELSTNRDSPQPCSFQTIVTLAVQAAEALQHAHENGVVHRDVKPSNLIIDHQGKLWVTDFGLAQMQADVSLTRTGELLGTLRYMSPEQASEGLSVIDHRTDVYSLGATLYELLTLQPLFDSANRPQLLRSILEKEPRPPRQLNQAIPRDLETILLKAIAKEPGRRYQSAAALADDLKRFDRGEPIRARRPSVRQIVTNWFRRHTGLVVLAGILISLLAIVAFTAALLTHRAYQAEKIQRHRAEQSLNELHELLDGLLGIAEADLQWSPQRRGVEPWLLAKAEAALGYYQDQLIENRSSPQLRYRLAGAHHRIGYLHNLLLHNDEAQDAFEQAVNLLESLAIEFPSEAEYQEQLAINHAYLAFCCDDAGYALEQWKKYVRILRDLTEANPNSAKYAWMFAFAHTKLGGALIDAGQLDEGEAEFERGIEMWEEVRRKWPLADLDVDRLAASHANWGIILLYRKFDLPRARQHLQEAVELRKHPQPSVTNPTEIRFRSAKASVYLGLARLKSGDPVRAEALIHQSIDLLDDLIDKVPDLVHGKILLAHAYSALGETLATTARPADAVSALRTSADLRRQVATEISDSVDHALDYGWAMYRLGLELYQQDHHDDAVATFRKAMSQLERATDAFESGGGRKRHLIVSLSSCPIDAFRDPERSLSLTHLWLTPQPARAEDLRLLGIVQFRAGWYAEAINSLSHALDLHESRDPVAEFAMAIAYARLGVHDLAQHSYKRAVDYWEDTVRVVPYWDFSVTDVAILRAEAEHVLRGAARQIEPLSGD